MSRRVPKPSVLRTPVRRLAACMCYWVALGAVAPSTARASEASAEGQSVEELVRRLGVSAFEEREEAQVALTELGERAFDAVLGAVDAAGERGERAVSVLNDWAFGSPSEDDPEFAERCEFALYEIADYGGVREAVRSDAALFSSVRVRRERGFADLKSDGVVFAREAGINDDGRPDSLLSVRFLPAYTGGRDGLRNLRRLADIPNLQILVATRSLAEADVHNAASHLESPDVWFRGGSLGITGLGSPCMIDTVVPGQAADTAGLREGDLILSLDETPVRNFGDLIAQLAEHEPDQKVTFEVRRYAPRTRRNLRVDPRFVDGLAEIEVTLGGWDSMPVRSQRPVRRRRVGGRPLFGPIPGAVPAPNRPRLIPLPGGPATPRMRPLELPPQGREPSGEKSTDGDQPVPALDDILGPRR